MISRVGGGQLCLCRHYSPGLTVGDSRETLSARTSQLITGICRGDRAALGESSPLPLVHLQPGSALIGPEIAMCCWRQQPYAIKNQFVASKAPYWGYFACSSLVLYGRRNSWLQCTDLFVLIPYRTCEEQAQRPIGPELDLYGM